MLDWMVEHWRWLGAFATVALVYVITGRHTDPRRAREVEAWRASWGPNTGGSKPKPGAKRVGALPGELARAVEEAGGGKPVGLFELVPKGAYLAVMAADAAAGSDHQTVAIQLHRKAPSFSVRPLPIVDGRRIPNTGVQFKKHPEFMELFLVEGADPKAIGAWLIRPLREALIDLPDAWLSVSGRTLTLTTFGACHRAALEDLVATADLFFVEHGIDADVTLLGLPVDATDETASDVAEREDDGDGDEDGDERSGEGEASPAAKAKPAPAALKRPQPTATKKAEPSKAPSKVAGG